MSKRMTSETVIFDTDWLTLADFGSDDHVYVIIDYQAYDTLKIIVDFQGTFSVAGGFFRELDVYKLKNSENDYRIILNAFDEGIEIYMSDDDLIFYLYKEVWESEIKGIGSFYIKGVKR